MTGGNTLTSLINDFICNFPFLWFSYENSGTFLRIFSSQRKTALKVHRVKANLLLRFVLDRGSIICHLNFRGQFFSRRLGVNFVPKGNFGA
jgi:hypothetical protein